LPAWEFAHLSCSLWSHAFVDLDEEPFVYSQPDTKGRFIVMQALNMWTHDFASSGSRTTGIEAGNFLIAGPKWRGTAPPDVKETFRSTTRYAWILVQIASDGPPDLPGGQRAPGRPQGHTAQRLGPTVHATRRRPGRQHRRHHGLAVRPAARSPRRTACIRAPSWKPMHCTSGGGRSRPSPGILTATARPSAPTSTVTAPPALQRLWGGVRRVSSIAALRFVMTVAGP
jgi:Protein of unknown function (DUF1254)